MTTLSLRAPNFITRGIGQGGQQTFLVKGQMVNIFGFVDHMVAPTWLF